MVGRVAGKVAVISGGASGIGAESARRLSREGAAVFLTDLQAELGEAVVDEIAAEGGRAKFMVHDVTDEAGWDQVVATALSHFGRLDVLLNSAGVGAGGGPILNTTFEAWRRTLSVNLDGTFLGVRAVAPVMVKARSGSIVNISSVMGKVGAAGAPAYCASKGGALMLTKAAALELAPHGVRVNSIHPGFIETPMLLSGFDRAPDAKVRRSRVERRHPLGRLGLPREIADGVVFLASDESSFMTGAELVIDGGYTAL